MKKLNEYVGVEDIVRCNFLYSSKQGGNMTAALSSHPNTLLLILTKKDNTIALYSSIS
jgi:hypothetical protein